MNLLIQLIQVIALKRKPQDIPYLPSSLPIILVAYAATTYFHIIQLKDIAQPLYFSIAHVLIQVFVIYFILVIAKKADRFTQMATASFGALALLKLMILCLMAAPALQVFAVVASTWSTVLLVIILRETFECNTLAAFFIMLAYSSIAFIILMFFFPEFYNDILQQMMKKA